MKTERHRWMTLLSRVALAFLSVLLLEAHTFGASEEKKTIHKGLVILVEFPDVQHDVTRSLAQGRFSQHLNSYVRQVSYNKVALAVDVTEKWYKMPDPVSRYKISSRNLEVDRSRVEKLIDDALAAAEQAADLSKYGFIVVFMKASVLEYGMIGLCGNPGMLGWRAVDRLKTRSGRPLKCGVAIFCYQAHVGTLFHDIAHILGGIKDGKRMVPCLYDHDLQSKPGQMRETAVAAMINMGFWDPMSCHYYKRGAPPPGISSWTRMRLNWLDSSKVKTVKPGQTAEVLLGPLELGAPQTLAIKIPLSRDTYYLIENRQHIGSDRVLPQTGVLIMYADDRIAECRHGRAPVKLINADPSVANLEGAAFDVYRKSHFQDDRNRIRIELKEKIGDSYRISISPP